MNKILVGLLAGAVLGAVDGLTAWFTPSVRDQMISIVFFSTIKGVVAGVAAGWFARRVHSVSKGIAFGFAVGLLLAFGVAAMPDPETGEHYWWQIMLPGSILGGVIGWATQRYGVAGVTKRAAATAALLLMVIASPMAMAQHEGHAAPVSNAVFDRLKSLEGTWTAAMMTAEGPTTTVEYRVTGGGSVVMERMFAGEPHEMINMYTVDKGSVMATHYCSAGNQPLLRYDAGKSTADELVFVFVSKTGNDGAYINGVRLKFDAEGRVTEEWGSSDGKPKLLYLKTRK